MARPRVSIIDPDEGVRESLKALVGTLGMDVEAFTTAEGFLTSVGDGAPPRCLITELNLPGMSGMQLMRRLAEERVRMPVVVLATDADVPTAVECMRLGAAHFMQKPVVGPDLARLIRRLAQADGRKRLDAGEPAPSSDGPRHVPQEVTMADAKTILVIDDDRDFQESMGMLLTSEGYRVVQAFSGREGLEKLRECNPDAILLDIMMESMSEGYGVAFTIKHQPEYEPYQHIPLIMLSSIQESPDERFPRAEETELIRPDRYLAKPVDLPRLLEILSRSLQHA